MPILFPEAQTYNPHCTANDSHQGKNKHLLILLVFLCFNTFSAFLLMTIYKPATAMTVFYAFLLINLYYHKAVSGNLVHTLKVPWSPLYLVSLLARHKYINWFI